MNLLFTINRSYVEQLNVLLKSVEISNSSSNFNIFVLHRDLIREDEDIIKRGIDNSRFNIKLIRISNREIECFPVYEKRYPVEIYFRLFASKYLPKNIDRVLYLDTDIVVINRLDKLYNMNFGDNYFIAATHIKKMLHKFHEIRLGIDKDDVYVNTGVILMNLEELRKISVEKDVIDFVKNNKKILLLPDQDILSTLYGNKIKLVDKLRYNFGERDLIKYNINNPNHKIDMDWIKRNVVIIHYYGRNKPWNDNYVGILKNFYDAIVSKVR